MSIPIMEVIDISDDDHGSDDDLVVLEESDYQYALALKAKSCSSSTVPKHLEETDDDNDGVMAKYRSFKSFDTVADFSDHHYTSESVTSSMQASQRWTKAIQRDWRLLKKDLPETIFVRAYEGRMDLLRAVIVGAAGTPYHDGLFFFDVYFPPQYPDTPPKVNYHAHGLGINPNLYHNGYVCLSLLNTWQGSSTERWTPGESTMLQVLLSIQALVLNEKPYYNEPGYASSAGSARGEKAALNYNESTFILSCRTMVYTLKNPPKYFEDYVMGHFRLRAYAILAACKTYIEGGQIGCVVEQEKNVTDGPRSSNSLQGQKEKDDKGRKGRKGGTSRQGKKSGTSLQGKNKNGKFMKDVDTMIGNLVPIFIKNGARNCEQFICQDEAAAGSPYLQNKRKRKGAAGSQAQFQPSKAQALAKAQGNTFEKIYHYY